MDRKCFFIRQEESVSRSHGLTVSRAVTVLRCPNADEIKVVVVKIFRERKIVPIVLKRGIGLTRTKSVSRKPNRFHESQIGLTRVKSVSRESNRSHESPIGLTRANSVSRESKKDGVRRTEGGFYYRACKKSKFLDEESLVNVSKPWRLFEGLRLRRELRPNFVKTTNHRALAKS